MDFNGYKRTKKFDIKRWFKGTNSIIYLVILVVMVLGLAFVLKTVIGMHNSNKNADEVTQEETTDVSEQETDTQTQTVARSGGEQQMLAVGRALMAKPKLIMMDEPSLGLAPIVVRGIFEIIREINRQGITVLLIEQNANMALKIADWAYVMQTGSILMQGPGEELAANEEVKAAYLGTAK